ncbi:MAG: hypothetical protein VX777_01775, partial [Chlamydiota bacterium]|nr:hypothetical protein [Chlamydiota bacterium]
TPPPPKVPTTPPPPKRQHLPPKKETVSETKSSNTTTQPANSNESPHFLTLDPITEAKESNFADIKKDVAELFPELKIIDQPPDDRAAKKVNQQWKKGPILPEVILLTFNETPEQTEFLLKVVNAINEHLAPAQMFSAYTIDKQRKWENMLKIEGLRLVIAPDYGIYSLPNLKKYYRESTVHAERTLAGIPVLLLTDVGLYIKQPSLKPALWKALCAILKDGS